MTRQTSRKSFKVVVLFCATLMALMACSGKNKQKYQFKSSEEAINACRSELTTLQGVREANIKDLTAFVNEWIELQDSVYNYLSNDTTMNVDNIIVTTYYNVSDSIRNEIGRLIRGKKRPLKDLITLKINTARDREKTISTKEYKEALSFYEILDQKEPTYKNADEAASAYLELLDTSDPFKKAEDVINFIAKEDECFRALMTYLDDVPQSTLAEISQKTGMFYDDVYAGIQDNPDNPVSIRMKSFLNIRANRRVIQNANTCAANLKSKKKINEGTVYNYRFMLIQPFLTIQDEMLASLTDKQIADMKKLAEDLPNLVAVIDKQKGEDVNQIKNVLNDFFITTYLNTL